MLAPDRNFIEQGRYYRNSKIIGIDEARNHKAIGEGRINELQLQYIIEIYHKMQELAILSDKKLPEKKDKECIIKLERENKELKEKLKKSFPAHIIIYMTICSLVIGISTTLLVLRFIFGIYIVEPYYVICALLISLTLFFTAVEAIRDWKDYMSDAKK